MAQWERAGPITQRSMDRNHPLLIFFFFFPVNVWWLTQNFLGMAVGCLIQDGKSNECAHADTIFHFLLQRLRTEDAAALLPALRLPGEWN